jgi:hypothetical protein
MHPILELMMDFKMKKHPKRLPMGPAGPSKPAKPPRGPRKPKVNRIRAVSNRDRPKTREIHRNLMRLAQRVEEFKKSLLILNENTEIDESR